MQDHRTVRLVRFALAFLGVSLLGFVLAWSFLAYRDPNLVVSFASLLQACGIPVGR
ncbi:MAG: hypothetical protein ROZ64_15990 [Burkholderiaceae bacterium]|jgi:hypothetical protein|nr:hypothetical protein [Burkholderiaceae bacterium]